jgi:hypothetical protein
MHEIALTPIKVKEEKGPYVVKLIYFKDSGKYYSEGEYTTELVYMHEIFDEVRQLQSNCELPGLVKGAKYHVVLQTVINHPHDHPALFLRKDI